MSLKSVSFAAAIALVAAAPAQAGEELLFGPVPDWVEPHEVDLARAPETTQPVRARLVDNQVRLEDGKRTVYTAYALQLQTPEGLSAGNIALPWRPETDDLTVHRVVIHRGSETIDVLESGQTFTTLRREQSLEQATLNGVLTANLFPADLQAGDTLEVVFSVVSDNPVFGRHDEILLGPMNAPVDLASARIMWPERDEMRLAKTAGMPAWRRSKRGGFEIAEITLENVETVPPPAGAPGRFSFIGFVEASDFDSWSDLAAHFAPLYAEAARIPAEGPLRTEVERIREASSDPVRQAEAALRLVQGRVRYVAVLMGVGGLVPADAATTWSRRYGDCKAKTALLLAILGELGIEAEPVLVNSAIGDALPGRLPMIGLFDHVLVRAHIGGRDYWMDGTRIGDTSLAGLETPAFDWGLPLRPGAELVRMLPEPYDTPREDLAITMDASNGVRAPVPTTIELTLRGDAAVGTNQAMASLVGEARDRALRDYWRGRFNFVEPERVALSFDEAARELKLTLEGKATLDWDGAWYETDETQVGFRADFTREPGPAQDAPYAVSYPFFDRTRQTIVLPPNAGFSEASISSDANVDETVAGIEYRRRATLTGNTFFVERTGRSIAPEFPAGDAPEFERRLRDLRDKRLFLRLPNGYRPTAADQAVTLGEMPNNARDLIAQGNEFANIGNYDEAIARFNRAIELAPNDSYAWANRGIALANKGSFAEARTDLDKAEELDPRNAVVFRARGLIAERQREFVAAIGHFTRAIELDPASSFGWGHRAMVHWGNNEPEKALADAAEAIRLSARYVEMYSIRAFILMSKGQRDQAAAEVERMMAANPDNPMALSVAGNIYRGLGMEDRARGLVERSVAVQPTPAALLARAQMRDASDTAGRLADLDEALRLWPDFLPGLATRANLRSQLGDTDGALADVEAAIRLNPAMTDLHQLKANLLRAAGRNDEALAAVAALVANAGEDRPALTTAGRIYASLGMYAEAVAALDKAVALLPEPFVLLDRSSVRDPADFAGRMADIDEALRKSPNYAAGLIAKGDLLAEQGDHAGAVRVIGQALRLEPRNPGLLVSRGIAQLALGRSREAERDFAEARSIASDASGLNSICYLKALAGVALESALEECNESLRLVPDVAATLDSRGAVLLRMGRLDEAMRDFDRALELEPELYPTLYLRAVARSRLGDQAGAQADLAAARTGAPIVVRNLEREGFVLEATAVAAAE